MTAPTQPPDPRVERIAKALAANKLSLITSVALARVLVEELGGREATVREIETVAEPVQRVTWGYDGAITATHNGAVYVLTGPEGARFEHKNLDTLILNWPQAAPHRAALETLAAQAQPSGKAGELDTRARVLVEELGAREANVAATEIDPRIVGWMDVCKTLDDVDPTWSTRYNSTDAAIMTIRHLSESLNACRAQQRENAETIKALTERVAEFDRANAELDNARKSAEQSARDLRDNNTTLRAELDAIKGAQRDPVAWMIVRTLKSGTKRTELANDPAAVEYANDDLTVTEITPLYEHPAPALPVVGACVIGVLTAKTDKETNSTSFHMDTSKYIPSKIVPPDGEYDIWLGAPLPTEGGK